MSTVLPNYGLARLSGERDQRVIGDNTFGLMLGRERQLRQRE
jgi:hypothetical protein